MWKQIVPSEGWGTRRVYVEKCYQKANLIKKIYQMLINVLKIFLSSTNIGPHLIKCCESETKIGTASITLFSSCCGRRWV